MNPILNQISASMQVCMLPSPLCGIVLPSQGKERLNFGQTLKVGLWYHLYVMSFFQWHFCSCYNCYPSNNTAYTLLLYLLIFWYIFYLFIFILIWSIIWPNLIQTWLTMSLAQLQPLLTLDLHVKKWMFVCTSGVCLHFWSLLQGI